MKNFIVKKKTNIDKDQRQTLADAVKKSPPRIIKKANWRDIPLKKPIDPSSPQIFKRPATEI